MADFLVRLTESNIKATRDALDVFGLYDLQHETSYPFLEQRNWKITGSRDDYDITYEDRGKRVKHISLEALNSFNMTHDIGFMRAEQMGYKVSKALQNTWNCFSANKPLTIGNTALGPTYMTCRDQAAIEGMVSQDFMVQTVTFIIQERTGDVLQALDRGDLVPRNKFYLNILLQAEKMDMLEG